MAKSKLTDETTAFLYQTGLAVQTIADMAGITRQAIHSALARAGAAPTRRAVLDLACKFCGEHFRRPRSHKTDRPNAGYCSPICFHADRSTCGEYSRIGGVMTRVNAQIGKSVHRKLSRVARAVVERSGVKLEPGQVVHHIDGNRENWSLDNLQIFESQSAHMSYHHTQRAASGRLV